MCSFINKAEKNTEVSIYVLNNTLIYRHQPQKKPATQRRWSLTQVFYASYLEWTITNLSGEHGADSWHYVTKLYETITQVSN